MNVSFVGTRGLQDSLAGGQANGIGISQVVPFPWNPRVPVGRDYQNTIRRNRSDSRFIALRDDVLSDFAELH